MYFLKLMKTQFRKFLLWIKILENFKKIVISNDKGRLSKSEIERMVQESEIITDQDKIVKEKIDAKNSKENYIYTVLNTV